MIIFVNGRKKLNFLDKIKKDARAPIQAMKISKINCIQPFERYRYRIPVLSDNHLTRPTFPPFDLSTHPTIPLQITVLDPERADIFKFYFYFFGLLILDYITTGLCEIENGN